MDALEVYKEYQYVKEISMKKINYFKVKIYLYIDAFF